MLRFFNTLSRKIEEFRPLRDRSVRMYICGPTVWNFAHIGNFRTFVFGDIFRRYLRFKGYDVTHVFNLTDIDDRIINEAAKRGISDRRIYGTVYSVFLGRFRHARQRTSRGDAARHSSHPGDDSHHFQAA